MTPFWDLKSPIQGQVLMSHKLNNIKKDAQGLHYSKSIKEGSHSPILRKLYRLLDGSFSIRKHIVDTCRAAHVELRPVSSILIFYWWLLQGLSCVR